MKAQEFDSYAWVEPTHTFVESSDYMEIISKIEQAMKPHMGPHHEPLRYLAPIVASRLNVMDYAPLYDWLDICAFLSKQELFLASVVCHILSLPWVIEIRNPEMSRLGNSFGFGFEFLTKSGTRLFIVVTLIMKDYQKKMFFRVTDNPETDPLYEISHDFSSINSHIEMLNSIGEVVQDCWRND